MVNLVTIQEFKSYKGINSEEYDPIISFLIGGVSDFIKNVTNRQLIEYSSKSKIEYFNAVGAAYYLPEEFPLLSVSELATSVDGGVTYTPLVVNVDYFVDTKDDLVLSNTSTTGFLTSSISHNSGRITYRGGYVTTPLDLKLAALDLVNHYYKEEYIPSKALQGASVENPVIIIDGHRAPPHVQRTLDLYRVL